MKKESIFIRIYKIFLKPKETFQDINESPNRFSIILPGIILIYALIFYFLFFNPNLWKNLFFIQFSGFSLLSLTGLFFLVIFIFVIIFIFILLIINFFRQLITKKGKKKKLVVLNNYFYSLVPFLLILTQLPFLYIFGGHYQLLYLSYFYIGIYIFVFSLHIFYISTGIKVAFKISWKKTIVITGIYCILIIILCISLYYIIYYSNFSISWLGAII